MLSSPSTSSSSENKTKKRKHVTLTIDQKLEIINRLEKGENRNLILNDFNIGASTIYDIKKQKDALQKYASEASTANNTESRCTLKKPKLEILDSALYVWFNSKSSEGISVTGPMVIEKAKQFHCDLNIETPCKFSNGWLQRFKIRHGIGRLDATLETKLSDEDNVERYKEIFNNLILKWDLSRHQVYNAVKTDLMWRCVPTSALGNDQKCASKNKDRVTVLLCANAAGDRLTPLVIGKYKTTLKGAVNLPVHYHAHANAWLTIESFKDWFFQHFVPEVKINLKKRGMPDDTKTMLLLSNCTSHPPVDDLNSGNIFAVYLPTIITSLIQPLNQSVIQNFKCFYRRAFVLSLLSSDCNLSLFQKRFTTRDAIFAIALAWSQVDEAMLQRCWYKLWLNEDEQTLDVNNDEQNTVMELIKTVPGNPFANVSHEELLKWIEIEKSVPVAEELSDEQIIQSVVNPQEVELQEMESEEEPDAFVETKLSWEDAFDALNTFIKFAEYNHNYSSEEVVNLRLIREEFLRKKSESEEPRDIKDIIKQEFF